MSSRTSTLLFVAVLAFVCLGSHGVHAFGAGNIPSYSYVEGRAFRHGDIEDTLADLAKKSGGFALGALIGKGGSKFQPLDIKRVYFGNWLRDYSQAVDIAGLKKLQLQSILNLCMVLGFMAHGYVTNEFEVTAERLGCYLPTEHIDNPKGYGEGEDARKYHPGLRGPVDPRELEVDPHTGMKNYIASEGGRWDTSKALVRRTLEQCIHLGRQYKNTGAKADLYESYRLLGQALHTLEDFPAHSNFCEISLNMMGHGHVFLHVGDNVRVQAPNGKWVAPIVTGTFGSSDFIHSLLGEANDHLSEASVSDLNKELDKAHSKARSQGGDNNSTNVLRSLFASMPGGAGDDMVRDMDRMDQIRAGPAAGGKRPEDMSPQELHATLWQILSFRDSVVKKIEKVIQRIPGLGSLIEKIMDSISIFVFTTLEPFLKPLLKSATTGLSAVSGEVIDSHDQYEVFNDPRASDPTHSFLSKDHFNLILNEPAGLLAKVILTHCVNGVTKAWGDNNVNVHQVTEEILGCLFHPEFHNSNLPVQREMLQCMSEWAKANHKTITRLDKESVRNHKNVRLSGEGGQAEATGSYAYNQGVQVQQGLLGYANAIPGVQQASGFINQFNNGPGAGHRREVSGGGGGGLGEANSFYNHPSGQYGAPEGAPPPHSYAPPTSAPPPGPSFPGAPGGYGPPSGPPPGSYGHHHHESHGSSYPAPHHEGYAPSYGAPPGPPPPHGGHPGGGGPPMFPQASFPSFPGGGPSGPPGSSYPGGPQGGSPYPYPSAPGSGPPGFPSAQPGGGAW